MASLNINKIIKLITREVDIEYCEKHIFQKNFNFKLKNGDLEY